MTTSNLFKDSMFHCKKSCYQFPKLFLLHSEGDAQGDFLKNHSERHVCRSGQVGGCAPGHGRYDSKLVIEAQHVATGNRQLWVGARIRILFIQFSSRAGMEALFCCLSVPVSLHSFCSWGSCSCKCVPKYIIIAEAIQFVVKCLVPCISKAFPSNLRWIQK